MRPVGTLDTESVLDLQATAGNRAVGQLLTSGPADAQGGPSGASVQRKLDTARFSKAGFRAAGIKPGARLSGQSRFADIESALQLYEAAQSRADELRALDRIETTCNAWQQSPFRTKKHSAKKAAEEGTKSAEVLALLGDVRRERTDIMSTMDTQTLKSLDPDRAHESMVLSLVQALGIDVAQIKGAAPADLRSAYIQQVLVPYQLGRKAGKPGQAGQVEALMFQVGQVDVSKLPDGDSKEVIGKVQQAKLHETNELMEQPAPKFAAGGVSTEQVKPAGVPGWAKGASIAVTGNDDYRSKVKAMIPVIAGTAVGKMLLEGIGGQEPDIGDGVHGAKKQAVVEIKLPQLKVLDYVTPGGDLRYANAGGGNAVTFDANSDLIGKPGEEVAEPWRLREPVIGLFHELCHVYLAKKGGETWKEGGETLQVGSVGDVPELRIVGVNYKQKKADGKGEVTFPFSDTSRNPITENEFRKQFAASKGLDEFLLRPKYAKVPGQEELSTKPQPTK